MSKHFLAIIALLFLFSSCAGDKNSTQNSNSANNGSPSWYVNPQQNNSENLYGVAEGYSLEEATKAALADAASRLMVTISAESSLIREENQTSTNEEMRQKIKQNIEKISFTNFEVSESEKIAQKFFVEVKIDRRNFINQQKENLYFREKEIDDLEKISLGKNPIQRRNALIKILNLGKEVELTSRILSGAGEDINLKEKLTRIAIFQNKFEVISDKMEFYFEIDANKEISKIIRNSLNREKIKIATKANYFDKNQIIVRIDSSSKNNEIYGSHITKLKIDFENLSDGKILASNSLEVSGSSSIGEKESYASALSSLEEKIAKDGILKIIGIVN